MCPIWTRETDVLQVLHSVSTAEEPKILSLNDIVNVVPGDLIKHVDEVRRNKTA